MPNVSFMAPGSELELAQQDASRQRALADALRQQSMTPAQGIQAGQMYIAPSWTQGLAKMLQAYQARKVDERADEGLRAARSSYDTRTQNEVQDFVKNLRGTPGQTFQTGANEMGDEASTQTVAPQAPDINKAMMTALGSQNPMIQSMGGNILNTQVQGDMTQQMLARALQQVGGAGALTGGTPGTPGATGGASAPGGQQGGIPGVSPLALALSLSGNSTLGGVGKMAQEAYAKANEPVNVRPGGTIAQRNPATGQFEQAYFSGQVQPGMTRAPNGNVSVAPGFLESQESLAKNTNQFEGPVSLNMSGGQKAELSRSEYAHFQKTGQMPARYQQGAVAGQTPAAPAAPAGSYRTEADARAQVSAPMGADPKALDREIQATTADLKKPMDAASKAGLGEHLADLQRTKESLGVPGLSQSQQDQINQTRQTAAGKAVDETFAKDYVGFTTGGAADAAKQLAQLKDVTQALKTPKASLTGPVLGSVPDVVKKFTNPQSIAMRERVEEVVQRSLRAILGAQFTEKEGERLIARAYNPNLSESENSVRVGRLYNQLDQALQAKQDAASYFQKNNTLEGWKGKLPSINDFNVDAARAAGGPVTSHPEEIQNLLKKYGK